MTLGDGTHRAQDVVHRPAIVFPPVAGQDDHTPVRKIQIVQFLRGEAVVAAHRRLHSVDDGVSGDKDFALHGFPPQIFRICARGRKMQRGQIAHQRAVHLLGEGRVFIISTQSRLHMAHRHLVVKRRQRAGKGRGGIAVYQHQIGLRLLQHAVHSENGARRNGRKGLLLLHDVQVILRLQAENSHDGIQHLPVLPRQAADALDVFPRGKFSDQRRHFDCLRARSEHRHYLNFLHVRPPFCCLSAARRACPLLFPVLASARASVRK